MRLIWRHGLTHLRGFVPGLLLAALSVVTTAQASMAGAAQAQEPTAPPGLACPGLVPPGQPPDESPGWVLQWDWQWSTFNQAALTWPTGVAIDRSCNVYVADGKRNRLVKLSPRGETLAEWGSEGKAAGQFDRLEGVAVDGAGNVYAADSGNDRLQKFSPAGSVVLVSASQFGCRDPSVKCQVLPDAFFGTLNVAADSAGSVFAVDAYNQIQKFGADGARVGRWGSQGSSPAQFNQPRGVTLDRAGNIYVADTLNNRVQKVSVDGKPIAQWTSAGPIAFNQPRGVAVDGDGNVYVADTDAQRIFKLGSDGSYQSQWTRCSDDSDPCQQTLSGDDAGAFLFPYSLAVDGRGEVLVADTGNNRVQVLKAIPTWVRPEADPNQDTGGGG